MTACDVLVAGGGSAGLAAAVAAARTGAETILIERGGLLGGMASSALVHTICGLYAIREEPGAVFANDGFSAEFARRLLREGGAKPSQRMGRLDVLPHDPVLFAALCDDFAEEAPNLRVWLHSELISVTAGEGNSRLSQVELICRGRRETISAGAFVDVTGDASLVALAGAAFAQIEPRRLQRPAYVAMLRGLDGGLWEGDGRLQLAHAIATGVKAGVLPSAALGAGFRPAVAPDEAFITVDLAGGDEDGSQWDPMSAEMLGQVEFAGRRTVLAIARYFSRNVAGAGECRVSAWPARAGVRESRRAAGVYELSEEDVLSGSRFADGIAETAWPIELRERATGPRWRYPREGAAAQIPLRCLRHRDVPNLWTAGRCISASHEAQGAIRVIGTCLATGEAAGLAAAGAPCEVEMDWASEASLLIRRRENLKRSC